MNEESEGQEFKTRNILSVEERVQVIREYEHNPIYQRLAEKFNCSAKQIKNIIANRDAVLQSHASCNSDSSMVELRRRRQQKIAFLGKVIYEYVERAIYHNVAISASKVRQKAVQIKESIAIENFYPNCFWLENFQNTYNIKEFDLAKLKKTIKPNGPKDASFNSIDLIQCITRREKENLQQQLPNQQTAITAEQRILEPLYNNPKSEHNYSCQAPATGSHFAVVKYESDDTFSSMEEEISGNSKASSDMDCEHEVMRHLRALEVYAMLSENYRAIGLIGQLEDVLKNPPKQSDFEP